MCIIFHKPKGIVLSEDIIDMCWKSNPHGAGLMVSKDGNLIVKKGFLDLDEFKKAFEEFKNDNVVAHFRWATHGEKDETNCHPFVVNDDLAFVHNGVIHGIHESGSDKSDTWFFNEKILKPLLSEYKNAWHNKTIKFLLQEQIGTGNKLVFLSSDGTVAIYNEFLGEKEHGCWFSNTDYKKLRDRGSKTKTFPYTEYNYNNYNNNYNKYSGNNKKKEETEKEDSKTYIHIDGETFAKSESGVLVKCLNTDKVINPYKHNEHVSCDNCNIATSGKDVVIFDDFAMCRACFIFCNESVYSEVERISNANRLFKAKEESKELIVI